MSVLLDDLWIFWRAVQSSSVNKASLYARRAGPCISDRLGWWIDIAWWDRWSKTKICCGSRVSVRPSNLRCTHLLLCSSIIWILQELSQDSNRKGIAGYDSPNRRRGIDILPKGHGWERKRNCVAVDTLAPFVLCLIRKREQGLFVPRRITASCLVNALFKRQRRSFTIWIEPTESRRPLSILGPEHVIACNIRFIMGCNWRPRVVRRGLLRLPAVTWVTIDNCRFVV